MACPKCGDNLVLLVEPGALEFYCPNNHSYDVEALISTEVAAARRLLAQMMIFWMDHQDTLLREAEAVAKDASPAALRSYQRRALLASERIRTLQGALDKCG